MVFILLVLRAIIFIGIAGPLITSLWMTIEGGAAPWVILPLWSIPFVFQWITQNVIDDCEGLVWHNKIFRAGI
jgi:hypothetical protein